MPTPISAGELRILQLIPVLRVGGLERVATTLTLGLRDRVARVVVCSRGGPPFEDVLRSGGVEVAHIARVKPSPKRLAATVRDLVPVLRRERPHVIHAHNPAAAFAAAAARRLALIGPVPIVTTYHGVLPGRVGHAARVLGHASDLVVGVGPSSTEALVRAGLPADRARTIHNAVDPAVTRTRDDVRAELGARGDLVVTVGRYAPEKNQALLLEAAAALAPQRPGLRVALVGDGPTEDDLRERVRTLDLDAVATVTGERADAVDFTAAADVFVLSSDSEGLPLVLLEAMAVGTPVVSTDAGGVGDAIVHGETGVLVPVGDAAALARAVARLLDDGTERARLAANAREFVRRTASPEAMVEGYLELYSELAGRVRPRAFRTGARPST